MRNKPINGTGTLISRLSQFAPGLDSSLPWEIVPQIEDLVRDAIGRLPSDYRIEGSVAIHRTATIEAQAVLKGPLIISENCFIAANAYLRNGVFLDHNVRLGPGCEVKTCLIFANTALAHFNFAGDSIIGSEVNMEAGAVIANHYNERHDKEIRVRWERSIIRTGLGKFGAVIGDGSKLGANAVLSPGTILNKDSIVNRLQLVKDVGRSGR